MNPLKWQWNTIDVVVLPMFFVAMYEKNLGRAAIIWIIWLILSAALTIYGKNKWGWK